MTKAGDQRARERDNTAWWWLMLHKAVDWAKVIVIGIVMAISIGFVLAAIGISLFSSGH